MLVYAVPKLSHLYIAAVRAHFRTFLDLFLLALHNIFFRKPLAAFPHYHIWNNGHHWWSRDEFFRNDYQQSWKKNIGRAWDRTTDILFSSPARYLRNQLYRLGVFYVRNPLFDLRETRKVEMHNKFHFSSKRVNSKSRKLEVFDLIIDRKL